MPRCSPSGSGDTRWFSGIRPVCSLTILWRLGRLAEETEWSGIEYGGEQDCGIIFGRQQRTRYRHRPLLILRPCAVGPSQSSYVRVRIASEKIVREAPQYDRANGEHSRETAIRRVHFAVCACALHNILHSNTDSWYLLVHIKRFISVIATPLPASNDHCTDAYSEEN